MDEKNGGPFTALHESKRGIFQFRIQILGETLLGVLYRPGKKHSLQLFQKKAKSASAASWRPIWHSFTTVGVRDFWENGCRTLFSYHARGDPTRAAVVQQRKRNALHSPLRFGAARPPLLVTRSASQTAEAALSTACRKDKGTCACTVTCRRFEEQP